MNSTVVTLESNAVDFSYLPPTITAVQPMPFNAAGDRLTIKGHNFGHYTADARWTPEQMVLEIVIGALRCSISLTVLHLCTAIPVTALYGVMLRRRRGDVR